MKKYLALAASVTLLLTSSVNKSDYPYITDSPDRESTSPKASVAVGEKFIDFKMADPEGKIRELSDFVGDGKNIVLIDFWASWCPPCRRDMPYLVEAYAKYKNQGFEIVGISLDNNADAWEKGVKNLGITWPQLSDLKGWENEGAALYGVRSIPHTLLVDKDGTIIAQNIHGKDLDAKLKEVLKK